jgi:hypothetical protein
MAEKRIFVKPADGLLIRDEYTGEQFPATGALVKKTTLITKHLRVGDLIECEAPAEPEPDRALGVSRKPDRKTTGSEG